MPGEGAQHRAALIETPAREKPFHASLTSDCVLGITAVLELDEREPHPDVNFLKKKNEMNRRAQVSDGAGARAGVNASSEWCIAGRKRRRKQRHTVLAFRDDKQEGHK